jgi:hypothetical protein
MQDITLITAIAGLAFGFLGAVLGIINTWRAFDRDRVRLRVKPVWTVFQGGTHTLSIEVINHSYIPVTVTQVGFTLRDRDKVFIFLPIQPGDSIPKRLEPRTSLTALAPFGTENAPSMIDVRRAFAKTACGCRFTGTSPALRGVVAQARTAGAQLREDTRHEG